MKFISSQIKFSHGIRAGSIGLALDFLLDLLPLPFFCPIQIMDLGMRFGERGSSIDLFIFFMIHSFRNHKHMIVSL